ncbi:MAG: phosphopentomutase [candidate division Zixibacteria bacterium]|nr:phosphopentomutase [candidate division Zixibacteria bacterium]
MFTRAIILILDACGVGELPDAAAYGDSGAATIPHVAKELGGLAMPNSGRLGLGNITAIDGVPPTETPSACYGKMAEQSPGKDSTSGHWEIGGVILKQAFPVYPDGFPDDLVQRFEQAAGVHMIGNCPASGTEIIKELGARHMQTGGIILYTSADSVFQLAAHEEIIPLDRLYEICRIARELLTGEHAVGRVIARPFVGTPGNFTRTTNRHDFSLEPPSPTILDRLQMAGIPTVSVGKIYDLFAGRGIATKITAKTNAEVMANLTAELDITPEGLLFANCVDFDMLWGHRNDVESFGRGLEEFDRDLEPLLNKLRDTDLLIITADHGCDPTMKQSTDHTREYVPLLVYNPRIARGVDLGTREVFADVAATLAEVFALKDPSAPGEPLFPGKSFLKEIVRCIA